LGARKKSDSSLSFGAGEFVDDDERDSCTVPDSESSVGRVARAEDWAAMTSSDGACCRRVALAFE
jgi:hypothetical protein